MPLNALFKPVARDFMPEVAPNASRATSKAYSTRSCPSSEFARDLELDVQLQQQVVHGVTSVFRIAFKKYIKNLLSQNRSGAAGMISLKGVIQAIKWGGWVVVFVVTCRLPQSVEVVLRLSPCNVAVSSCVHQAHRAITELIHRHVMFAA